MIYDPFLCEDLKGVVVFAAVVVVAAVVVAAVVAAVASVALKGDKTVVSIL